jgi:hypothetical protein
MVAIRRKTRRELPFRVEQKARNIHLVHVPIDRPSEDWEWKVLLRSDAHHDNPHARHDIEKRHLDECVKNNYGIIDVGDGFCAMGGKWDPRGVKGSAMRPEHDRAPDYLDSLVRHYADFLEYSAHNWLVWGRGNHTSSILKRHETDLDERLCQTIRDRTGAPMFAGGYGGFVQFVFNVRARDADGWRLPLTLKYFHGSGGGGMMTHDVLRTRRISSFSLADVYVGGHTHDQWHVPLAVEYLHTNGSYEVKRKIVHHVRCGTYKDEHGDGHSGFQIEKGSPPKPLGAVWMKFRLLRDDSRHFRTVQTKFELDTE